MSLSQGAALQEQLSQLQGLCRSQAEMMQQLDAEVTALRAKLDAARREAADAQFQLRGNQFLLDLAHQRTQATPAVIPPWLSQELKALVAVVHPDKWQGQAAEVLAHEACVALNALRQRLEVH
jgi:hypothetical protein